MVKHDIDNPDDPLPVALYTQGCFIGTQVDKGLSLSPLIFAKVASQTAHLFKMSLQTF